MQSPRIKLHETVTLNSSNFPVQAEILLTATLSPFIVGLLVAQSLEKQLIGLGQASEEVFRGSRLPLLHFSELESLKIEE